MKREQKEMQEFASLMKSMVHDNSQHTTRLQDKIVQVHTINRFAKERRQLVVSKLTSAHHKLMLTAGK